MIGQTRSDRMAESRGTEMSEPKSVATIGELRQAMIGSRRVYDEGTVHASATYEIEEADALIAALVERVRELEAIQGEQNGLLFAVGPIVCRNGKIHDKKDGCLYCEIATLTAENARLRDVMAQCIKDLQLWALDADVIEKLQSALEGR